jgi:hypothetical protein
MGNNFSFTPQSPPPKPDRPVYKTDKYNIPTNSGIIDIDVNNLHKCMSTSGNSLQSANSCVGNYVQGYDTTSNTFTPIKLSIQNFELVDNANKQHPTLNFVIYITIVIIYLIIMLR